MSKNILTSKYGPEVTLCRYIWRWWCAIASIVFCFIVLCDSCIS